MAVSIKQRKTGRRRPPNGLYRLFIALCLASVLTLTFCVSRYSGRQILRDRLSNLGSEYPLIPYIDPIATKNTTSNPIRKWAYAFLVGGALNPLTEYRGFLYGVVVAAKILRDTGTQADIVIMVQISYNSNATKLPKDEEDLLESLDVKIKYLPKFAGKVHEQFYALVMEKFRVLEMIEYSRVLFLDSDIMPLCKLDYMFELSEPTLAERTPDTPFLKENVVLSWKGEAGHAGFFMLAPGPGKFSDLQRVIRRREEEALNMSYPYWDPEIGWGHRFNKDTDFWRSERGKTGTLWNWWSSFADQGLIYFWAKYHQNSTSIIIGNNVESWGTDESGILRLERTSTGEALSNSTCAEFSSFNRHIPSPYRDYQHFTGRNKPWNIAYGRLEGFLASAITSKRRRTGHWYWLSTLTSAAQEVNYKISTSVFGAKKESVGRFSEKKLMYEHILAKRDRGWTAYR